MSMLSKVTHSKGADCDIGKDEQNDSSVSKDWTGWARQRTIMLVVGLAGGVYAGVSECCFVLGGGIL
jgi:hypothetical protein